MNRLFYNVQALGREIKILPVNFTGAGSSSPTVVGDGGIVSSVTRTAAGKYTIQLTDGFVDLVSACFMLSMATTAGFDIAIDSSSSYSAGTIKVVVFNASGTATDVASGDKFLGCLIVKNSNVNG